MNDIPPKYDPAKDPLLRLAQKISEHLGRIALEQKAQTEHLATLAGILKSKATSDEPAAELAEVGRAYAFWTGLLTRLRGKEFCAVQAYWPVMAPDGFLEVYESMGGPEILRVLTAYGKQCDTTESKRKWWKQSIFKPKVWERVVADTAPPVERKAAEPNVMTPAVRAIMDHVRARPESAAKRGRVGKEIRVGHGSVIVDVVEVGPGIDHLEKHRTENGPSWISDGRLGYALRYFIEVWEWAEAGFGDNPPRLERPDLFKEGDERKWPADAERIALEAVRLEKEACDEQA